EAEGGHRDGDAQAQAGAVPAGLSGREAVVLALEVVVRPHTGVEDGHRIPIDPATRPGPAGGHVLGGLQRGRTTTADGGRRPEPPPRRDRSPGGPGAEVRRRDPPVV